MLGPDGKPTGRVCFRSGYLEYMKPLLTEMLAYGIDGFHLDMVDQGFGPPYGCWCSTCKEQFQEKYAAPMPAGPTWDEAWDHMLEFRYESSHAFEKALLDHVREVAPGATVDFNYHGSPPFSWEVGQLPVRHANNADFITGETGIWGFSALGVGLNARFYSAATPGRPVQVAIQRGVRNYHDQTTRPVNDLRWELLTLLAHGTFVTIVDKTAFDGWLDPVAYARFGEVFREVHAKRAHFGQPLIESVGLYYSARSRDWYGRDEPFRYQRALAGAQRTMVYEHIPYGILLDENLSHEMLSQHRVVILPNVAILEPSEIERLRHYVEEGGKLVITGITGAFNHMGQPDPSDTLAELIGARRKSVLPSEDNHVRLPIEIDEKSQALSAGIPADWPFLVYGPAVVYQPTTAQPIGDLHRPHRTKLQQEGKEGTGTPMSAGERVGPAILINKLGKGRVLTFAASPDVATSSEFPVIEVRYLLRNAVRWLDPEPTVEVEAPTFVESVVSDDAATRTLRVHLLGYSAPPTPTPGRNRPFVLPGLIEDVPSFRARIRVRRPVQDVRVLDPESKLYWPAEDWIEVEVKDLHETIVIQY